MIDWTSWSVPSTGTREATREAFGAIGSKIVHPGASYPMELLREEQPPLHVAQQWWNTLFDCAPAHWDSNVFTVLRLCRTEHYQLLVNGRSSADAIARTEMIWDSWCSTKDPSSLPCTVTATLRQMERRLAEVVMLQGHARALLRSEVYADASKAPNVAEQLYAIEGLAFDKEVRWVTNLRVALETSAPIPQGEVYPYVEPVIPEPKAEATPVRDPFDF